MDIYQKWSMRIFNSSKPEKGKSCYFVIPISVVDKYRNSNLDEVFVMKDENKLDREDWHFMVSSRALDNYSPNFYPTSGNFYRVGRILEFLEVNYRLDSKNFILPRQRIEKKEYFAKVEIFKSKESCKLTNRQIVDINSGIYNFSYVLARHASNIAYLTTKNMQGSKYLVTFGHDVR